MKASEKMILLGALLIIVSVFLPWQMVVGNAGAVIPGLTGGTGSNALLYGYQMTAGWAVLVAAMIVALLVLIPFNVLGERLKAAQYFFAIIAAALVVFNAVIPAFTAESMRPHIGILGLVAGAVLLFVGLSGQPNRG